MKIFFRTLKPEVFFLFASLLFGIAFSIFIPYGAGFDEETHLVRIFDISGGHLIPNRPTSTGNYTFSEFYSLSYQRRPIQTPAGENFTSKIFTLQPNWQNMSSGHTESTYLPIMFFPEALIAGLGWRVFSFPLFPVIIITRIIGLITYAGMCYFSIRLLPAGKWVMTILLLAPMALFQASTLNGDHFTIAASAVFIAYLINILSTQAPIQNKEVFILSGVVLLIGIAKPGTVILLPALLLLFGQKFRSKFSPLIIILSTIISIAISVYWSSIAVLNTTYLPSGATRADQIRLIMSNLPDFIKVFLSGSIQLLPRFFTDWVAEYGYWVGKVPWPVYWFFVFSLILAYFTESKSNNFRRSQRVGLFILGLICLGIMASIKLIWNYDPDGTVFDTQGRYFLPYAPLVLVALIGLIKISKIWQERAVIGSVICLLVSLAFYSYGIYRTYYTTCIYAVDAQHPCTLPVYRNLDTENPVNLPVTSGITVEQTFQPNCGPIDAIDLRVLSLDGPLTGSVGLRLFDASGELLQEGQIPLKDVKVGEQNRVSFPDTPITRSGTYSFQVTLSEDASATLGLWGAPDDGYTAGQLSLNGSPAESAHDLYFQYECPR